MLSAPVHNMPWSHHAPGRARVTFAISLTTAGSTSKKRGRVACSDDRVAYSNDAEDSEESDSAGSADERASSRPKKRFLWPEVLLRKCGHRIEKAFPCFSLLPGVTVSTVDTWYLLQKTESSFLPLLYQALFYVQYWRYINILINKRGCPPGRA